MTGYEDSLAVLSSSGLNIPADQEVTVTIHKTGGYTAPGSHEVELQLRWGMSAHSAPGYEVLIPISGNPQIIRQNGDYGDFTVLSETTHSSWVTVAHGDVIRAKIVGSTISVYQNGTLRISVTDTTFATGSPGMGFFVRDAGTPSSYCISAFSCGAAT